MTIGEAKEIIRRYQVARQGFSDFAVTQQEFDEALDLIASGVFLSDDIKDHPNAKIVQSKVNIPITAENFYPAIEIEEMLKHQIAQNFTGLLIQNNLIQFKYEFQNIPDPIYKTVNHVMSAKLIVVIPDISKK